MNARTLTVSLYMAMGMTVPMASCTTSFDTTESDSSMIDSIHEVEDGGDIPVDGFSDPDPPDTVQDPVDTAGGEPDTQDTVSDPISDPDPPETCGSCDEDGDGFTPDLGDCCDTDRDVYPGQMDRFTVPTNCGESGSIAEWDYNCDGEIEISVTTYSPLGGGACREIDNESDCDNSPLIALSTTGIPPCGSTAWVYQCEWVTPLVSCDVKFDSIFTQSCR